MYPFDFSLSSRVMLRYIIDSLGAPHDDLGNYADLEVNPDAFGDLHQMSDIWHIAEFVGIGLGCVALVALLIGVVVWVVRRRRVTEKDDPMAIP
jgi:hypothetical protein